MLRADGSSGPVPTSGVGSKRSFAYDEFFTDVKKRRVSPSYDPREYAPPSAFAAIHSLVLDADMAERLTNLARTHHTQSLSQTTIQPVGPVHHPQGFNPRSVSFDIRSPEELAAVNEFLITLGRDVTGPNVPRSMHDHPEYSSSPQSYFDPVGLAQLGIAGMPGVPNAPGSGASYHGDSGYASSQGLVNALPQMYPSRSTVHPSLQHAQHGLYPSASDMDYPSGVPASSFRGQPHQRVSPLHDGGHPAFHQPTPQHFLAPQYDPTAGGASPMSSHSSMSTPPNATPPHMGDYHSFETFDYMRQNRGPPPAVQLDPVDLRTRSMRTIVPLRSAGTRETRDSKLEPPKPVEPNWNAGPHRGPLKLTSECSTSSVVSSSSSGPSSRSSSPTSLRKSDSLYSHLLKDGDEKYKLPPISQKYRSTSPTSTASPLSRASTISPPPTHRVLSPKHDEEVDADVYAKHRSRSRESTASPPPTLPPLRTLAPAARSLSLSHYAEERLVHGVGRIALDGRASTATTEAQRRQHAELLRDILVAVNTEYRRKFGTPPPVKDAETARRKLQVEGSRDVEMVAV